MPLRIYFYSDCKDIKIQLFTNSLAVFFENELVYKKFIVYLNDTSLIFIFVDVQRTKLIILSHNWVK